MKVVKGSIPWAGDRNGVGLGKPYVYHGTQPYKGPDTAKQVGATAQQQAYEKRLQLYAELRDCEYTMTAAAEAMHLPTRTARRYEKTYQDAKAAAAPEPGETL